jgi:hypothetical protein
VEEEQMHDERAGWVVPVVLVTPSQCAGTREAINVKEALMASHTRSATRLSIAVLLSLILSAHLIDAERQQASPEQINEPAPMTNEAVVRLAKGGLSEALIITAIRTAQKRAFVLTPDALIDLKAAGISENILTVMLNPDADVPYSAPQPSSALPTSDPRVEREPGIYVDLGKDSPELVLLEPTVFSQAKSGGVFLSGVTYGLVKAKWKAVVRGSTASQRLRIRQPTFYFYFEQKGAGLSHSAGFAGWFSGSSSPNQFVLAKMDRKENGRELVIGEWGTLGSSTGTRSKDTVGLSVERLSPGIYRVKTVEPLQFGREYCFFYAGAIGSVMPGTGVAAAAGNLFDFGVDPADTKSPSAGR